MNTTEKMKVEIWSDIMCPFCYIGKRKFEKALQQFSDAGAVEVEWHSFQLDPSIEAGHGKNLYEYLSERKGISYEQSVQMHRQVTQMAKEAGLTYNFDNAVVANSFDAHRMIQLAKKHNLGDEAEERLFKAYFTEGKDFSDHETLVLLGQEIGLQENDIRQVLASDDFGYEVEKDIREAQTIGVRGVPFFVFNRKYAVSGAQPSDVFSDVLGKSFTEWRNIHPAPIEVIEGPSCTPEGDCN
ncbi:DsbA family oxidoreductase [Xanthocytophaga flava]|nr:DsbA family oxidoreductase [Xanthocytophaga flavus]